MLSIDPKTYRAIAASVAHAIADKKFFNGSVEYDTDEFYSTLRMTLIIYRDSDGRTCASADRADRACGHAIRNIIPVWWEFSLSQPGGEVDTDFSWRELVEYLL